MEQIFDNTTSQLIYAITDMIISISGIIITFYSKRWLETSSTAKKYELDQIITEKVIYDAVKYAEDQGRQLAVKGIEKKKFANEYIDAINPELVVKYGDKLSIMLDRKVAEVLNKK